MCRLPKEILLPSSVSWHRARPRLVCEDHGSFMGARGVRNRFRICFAAILGQGADCVDSRMAIDSEDHAHTDSTDAADNALVHVEHADHNVAACLP
jgi:hypothetical protein